MAERGWVELEPSGSVFQVEGVVAKILPAGTAALAEWEAAQ